MQVQQSITKINTITAIEIHEIKPISIAIVVTHRGAIVVGKMFKLDKVGHVVVAVVSSVNGHCLVVLVGENCKVEEMVEVV